MTPPNHPSPPPPPTIYLPAPSPRPPSLEKSLNAELLCDKLRTQIKTLARLIYALPPTRYLAVITALLPSSGKHLAQLVVRAKGDNLVLYGISVASTSTSTGTGGRRQADHDADAGPSEEPEREGGEASGGAEERDPSVWRYEALRALRDELEGVWGESVERRSKGGGGEGGYYWAGVPLRIEALDSD